MTRIPSLSLLVCGIVLVGSGINVAHDLGFDLSRFFDGATSDRAIWLLIGGIVTAVIGGLLRGAKAIRPAHRSPRLPYRHHSSASVTTTTPHHEQHQRIHHAQ